MLDEGNDLNMETPEETPPPEESNNRTFLIVGGVLAALIFLTLVCGAIYVLWLGPRLATQRNAAQATIEAGNAQVVQQMTSTAVAALFTPTTPATDTPLPTNTPLPVALNSPTPIIAVVNPATATPTATPNTTPSATTNQAAVVAMQTQLSQQMTSTLGAQLNATQALAAASTAIPKTGFFDQVGLPSLVVLTLALLTVIFLSRRLRNAPPK